MEAFRLFTRALRSSFLALMTIILSCAGHIYLFLTLTSLTHSRAPHLPSSDTDISDTIMWHTAEHLRTLIIFWHFWHTSESTCTLLPSAGTQQSTCIHWHMWHKYQSTFTHLPSSDTCDHSALGNSYCPFLILFFIPGDIGCPWFE